MLRHIKPTKEYKDKIIDFVNEFNGEYIEGSNRLQYYLEHYTYEGWINYLKICEDIIPNEYEVPSELYLLIDENDVIIGIAHLRLSLNKTLDRLGGNIGYSIRPSKRNNGYGKYNLYLSLKRFNELNIDTIKLAHIKDNEASKKVMLSLGAKFVEEIYDETYKYIDKYIIEVKDSIREYELKVGE